MIKIIHKNKSDVNCTRLSGNIIGLLTDDIQSRQCDST